MIILSYIMFIISCAIVVCGIWKGMEFILKSGRMKYYGNDVRNNGIVCLIIGIVTIGTLHYWLFRILAEQSK